MKNVARLTLVIALIATFGVIGGWFGFGFAPLESGVENFLSDSFGNNFPEIGFCSACPIEFPDDDVASAPELGTLALFGIGLFGMGLERRRKRLA